MCWGRLGPRAMAGLGPRAIRTSGECNTYITDEEEQNTCKAKLEKCMSQFTL